MSIKIGDFVKGITNDYGVTDTKMTRGLVTDVCDGSIVVRVLDHDDGADGTYTVDPKKFEVIGCQKQFDRAEVLKLLKDGCKKAILDYDLRDADLRGADLSYADLSDADFRGADLSGADLSYADLRDADLRGANLNSANLNSANLNSANLKGANFSGAFLKGTNSSDAFFVEANLKGADLRDADLSDADLSDADLSDADFRGADLRGADLRGANLSGANLSGADLDYSCYPLWCGSLHLKADKRLACQLAYHLCSMQCDDADYIKMRNSILDFANQFHRVKECGKLEEREI